MILHSINVFLVCLVITLNIAAPCMCTRYALEMVNVGFERHSIRYFSVAISSWAVSWPLTGAILKLIPGDHLTLANWFQLALNYEQALFGFAIVSAFVWIILFEGLAKVFPRILQ